MIEMASSHTCGARRMAKGATRPSVGMHMVCGFAGLLAVMCATCSVIGPVIHTCSDADTSACLYAPERVFEPIQLSRIELRPAHRVGPVPLSEPELSVLPVTVWVPDGAPEPLPVVVWSHGGGSRQLPGESAPNWSPELAKAGYAVLAMHHMARSQSDLEQNVCQPLGVSPADCDPAVYTNVYESMDRGRDAISVLDSLEDIGASLGVVFDADRVAVAAHSGGTNAPLYLSGGVRNVLHLTPIGEILFSVPDPRPKAFIGMSPPGGESAGWTPQSLATVERPFLSATGAGDIEPQMRIELHDQVAPVGKHRMFINSPDATHAVFNLGTNALHDVQQQKKLHRWVVSATIAFLDAYLRERADAHQWLQSGDIATAIDADVVPREDVPSWATR